MAWPGMVTLQMSLSWLQFSADNARGTLKQEACAELQRQVVSSRWTLTSRKPEQGSWAACSLVPRLPTTSQQQPILLRFALTWHPGRLRPDRRILIGWLQLV